MRVKLHLMFGNNKRVTQYKKSVCMHLMGPARTNYRVMNDASALFMAGYDVTIVDVIEKSRPSRIEDIHGIHFIHIAAPDWFVSSRFKPWFLIKLFALIIRCIFSVLLVNADVYHAHVEHAFLATYLAARIRRKRLIFDTPELTMFGPTILRWPRIRAMAIYVIRKMSSSCDRHITGSPLYVPILAELYQNKRMRIIRHVPPYRSVTKSDLFHRKLGLSPHIRIALYQGYLQPDRGLSSLVLAAAHLDPDKVIVMMGDSYGTTESELRRLIQLEHVEDRVKIIPAVPYDCLLDWTAAADIGLILLPADYSISIRKCLPNKFFEYLMAGIPILSAELDAVAELVRRYDVGTMVSTLDPACIGAAINKLLDDSEARARIRENALSLVHEAGLYWEEEQKKLVTCYSDLFHEKRKIDNTNEYTGVNLICKSIPH
jgi:glycosyltransferase involved in cell wall biosynthesis